jgi:hypothetical protein
MAERGFAEPVSAGYVEVPDTIPERKDYSRLTPWVISLLLINTVIGVVGLVLNI